MEGEEGGKVGTNDEEDAEGIGPWGCGEISTVVSMCVVCGVECGSIPSSIMS